jgi:hypothetical protein
VCVVYLAVTLASYLPVNIQRELKKIYIYP